MASTRTLYSNMEPVPVQMALYLSVVWKGQKPTSELVIACRRRAGSGLARQARVAVWNRYQIYAEGRRGDPRLTENSDSARAAKTPV